MCGQDGWILAKFSFALWNETKWTWTSAKFYRGSKRAIPSGQYRFILPFRVANHNTEFAASCPLTEPLAI